MKFKKTPLILLFVMMVLVLTPELHAEASDMGINTNRIPYDIKGDAGYINYSDQYYLDIKETNLMESPLEAANYVANVLFKFIVFLGKTVCAAFYYCMTFDLAAVLSNEISTIQRALKGSIFDPLFKLAFGGAAVFLLGKMMRRDIVGMYVQFLKIIGIVVLAFLVVDKSDVVLSQATAITKAVSTEVLTSMQNAEGVTDNVSYAARASGALWVNMVHNPWVALEFEGARVDEYDIDKLLANEDYAEGSETRKKFVEDSSYESFSKNRGARRIAFLLLYLIPFSLKCVIYLFLAILTLVSQLMAVLYVFMAPVILLMALIPGYEKLLTTWLRKLLETQISMLIMFLVTGLLIRLDEILFNTFSSVWGWFVVAHIQTAIYLAVLLKHEEIIGFIGKAQKAAFSPGYANGMLQNANANSALVTRNIIQAGLKAGSAVVGTFTGNPFLIAYGHDKLPGQGGKDAAGGTAAEQPDDTTVERPVMQTPNHTAGRENTDYRRPQRNPDAAAVKELTKEIARPRMDMG